MQLHLNSKTNGDRVRLPTLTTINTFNNSESHKTKNSSKSIYGMFGFGSTTKKDKMSNETTSLLPSSASGNTSSYYFLPKTEAEGGVHTSVRDADVTESVPAGSTEAEFAPRQVGLKVRFLMLSRFHGRRWCHILGIGIFWVTSIHFKRVYNLEDSFGPVVCDT